MDVLGVQRPRAETDYDVADLEVLEERADPEAEALRKEFYKLEDKIRGLIIKQQEHDKATAAYQREAADPDPIPGVLRAAQTKLAFNPGLTLAQKKRVTDALARMREIEAIPGVIPKTGTGRRRAKTVKTNRRIRRTRKHKKHAARR